MLGGLTYCCTCSCIYKYKGDIKMKQLLSKLKVWWYGDYSHNNYFSYSRQTLHSKEAADGLAYEDSAKYKLLKLFRIK